MPRAVNLDKLTELAFTANVPHRLLAALLGVSVSEFSSWLAAGAPLEYSEEIKDMQDTLALMLKKKILPKSLHALAAKGLIELSKEGACEGSSD